MGRLDSIPGLRRVSWVKVSVGDGEPTATAFGLGHHAPAVVPISVRLAALLASTGVPIVVRQHTA